MSRIKYILSYFTLATTALLKERDVDIIYTISQPPVLGANWNHREIFKNLNMYIIFKILILSKQRQ